MGDTVTLTWAAKGDVVLSADPVVPQAGPKASSGSEQLELSRTTRFVLRAHRMFSSTTAEADVVVVPEAREFGGMAVCSVAERVLTLSFTLADQVSSALMVASLTNMNARDIMVAKGDIRVTIPARSLSTAFAGQPAAGSWTLQAPLAAHEACDEALAAVANRLTVRLALSCGG